MQIRKKWLNQLKNILRIWFGIFLLLSSYENHCNPMFKWIHCMDHRVGRVLSFFSSFRNWDSPNPSPAGECTLPPPDLIYTYFVAWTVVVTEKTSFTVAQHITVHSNTPSPTLSLLELQWADTHTVKETDIFRIFYCQINPRLWLYLRYGAVFSLVPVYNFGKIRLLISYWNALLSSCNHVVLVMYLIKNTEYLQL